MRAKDKVENQRGDTESYTGKKHDPLHGIAGLHGFFVVADHGHAFLKAVADRLYLRKGIVLFAFKAEGFGGKVEADRFKAVGVGDLLLDFLRAVRAVKIFKCAGVLHKYHSKT